MFAAKRLGKELTKCQSKLPPGIILVRADDLKTWELDIKVLDSNPIYANQTFRLIFIFNDQYPIEPPEVTFLYVPPSTATATSNTLTTSSREIIDLTNDAPPSKAEDPTHRPIPIHPHIYSNGIICLDLLSSAGWSPVQSVESVCMSLQSMLTGNTKNERPPGDKEFCASMGPRGKYGWTQSGEGGGFGRRGRGLRDVRFEFDDDTV